MKIVGVIPARLGTDKEPFQNIKELGGIPLVNYTVRTMNKVKLLDDIVVFSSEPSICDYIYQGLRYNYLERPSYLNSSETKVQDIMEEFLRNNNADIIVLWHIISPFLKPSTINECIEQVKSGKNNSAFTATEIKKFCWFKGKPLNYSLSQPTPRTQDIQPLIVEQGHLYVFRRDLFEKTKQRIDQNPYIKIIDHFEAHEISSLEDFKIAELIVNTGFFDID